MTEPPDPPPAPTPAKSAGAFLTIGELAAELGVAAHVLRYWESRFEQLRPLQRAGGRRYYRPADAELARRVHGWLTRDGYTVKGVQGLLARGAAEGEAPAPAEPPPAPPVADDGRRAALVALRDELAAALRDDEPA